MQKWTGDYMVSEAEEEAVGEKDLKKRKRRKRSGRNDMQINGLLGQKFCVFKKRKDGRNWWRYTSLHADAHREGCFIRVSTLVGDSLAWPRILCLKAKHHGVLFLVRNQYNLTTVGCTQTSTVHCVCCATINTQACICILCTYFICKTFHKNMPFTV